MGGGDEAFVLLSGEGISSKVDLDSKWHSRLENFRQVENLHSLKYIDGKTRVAFTVPRIVVIGEESSGKSSTMERIAMMQFFPTDRKLCTRMPIELRLRYSRADDIKGVYESIDKSACESYVKLSVIPSIGSKLPPITDSVFPPHEAATKIKEWMDSLTKQGNGSLSGILKDVLVIELYSTRKLNLDLIDLPGIVGASLKGEPNDMMIQTRQLAESYLNDSKNPHCLVVCVISSRTERVRNSQAIELVQRFNKQDSTIGVLTMIDLSKDTFRNTEDPYWELKERLDGTSQDMPELKFGYVALKNRDTVQKHQLADINNEELQWLRMNVPELEAMLTDDVNSINSIGINSLILKLLLMLDIYSETKWAPEEFQRLCKEVKSTQREIDRLGVPFDSSKQLAQTVIAEVNKYISSGFNSNLPMFSFENIRRHCHALNLKLPSASYVSESYFTQKIQFLKEIKTVLTKFLDECLRHPVSQMVENIFKNVSKEIRCHLPHYSKFRVILTQALLLWSLERKEKLADQLYNKIASELNNKNGINDYYIKDIIFDLVYTELLLNPLNDLISKTSIISVYYFMQPTSSVPTITLNETFYDKLCNIVTEQEGCDITTAETILCTEDCFVQRQQLNYKLETLNAMTDAIKSEFPSYEFVEVSEKEDDNAVTLLSWDMNRKPVNCTFSNDNLTATKTTNVHCGIIGNIAVDRYTVQIINRGSGGGIMIGFTTGTTWNVNGGNYSTNGWFIYVANGSHHGPGATGRDYSHAVNNGDYITVIRQGNTIRFEKNKVDLGVYRAFTNIPDQPLFPAIDINEVSFSVNLVNDY